MPELPGSVLFACTMNAIRSPMAEALLKLVHGRRIYVQSAGVRPGILDPFAVLVMDEIGIDIGHHRPRTFADLEDDFFDCVVSLSPEAQHNAVELTRTHACELMYWRTPDPSIEEGSRERRLAAYREVRDMLAAKIREVFPRTPGPQF